ncbi:MAG: restriction endonuclease subunit S [Desulfatitalea sp.]
MMASREDAKSRRNNWETIPLRYVCELNPSVNFEDFKEDNELTFLPMDRIKSGYFIPNTDKFSKYASSYNAFEEGDIVLAKVTPCFENGNIAVAENLEGGKGFGSSELFVIRSKKVNRKFLFYYFQSSAFKQEGEASMTGAGGLKRVSPDLLRQHHLPFPEEQTQRLIADYLDRETARIDALVAEKEKMLALLKEKRAALISSKVTRGLDESAPLKPSGLDWLGDIPAHWKVRRCATLFQEIDERDCPELPLLNVSLNTGVTLRVFSDDRIESVAADFSTYKVARKGDLVFNKMRFWQGAGGIAPEDGLTSPDYTVARFSSELDERFVELLVRLPLFSNEVRRYSYGMVDDRLRLYWMEFRNLRIPVPPLGEQKEIVNRLDSESEITALVSALQQSISLANERRAALITAAVTGLIPVEEMRP